MNEIDTGRRESLSLMGNLDHIRSYYEALNTGDAELVASTSPTTRSTTTRVSARTRAPSDRGEPGMGVNAIEGQWYLEHGIEQGDEAVIEWTMTWRDPKSGEKRLDRGTEWFLMRDGKIAEVRAYHHGGKKNPQGDLLGFDHAGAVTRCWRTGSRRPVELSSAGSDMFVPTPGNRRAKGCAAQNLYGGGTT